MTLRPGNPSATLLYFGLTIAVLLVMRVYFPDELAVPMEGSDIRPVLLLEFATTPAHLAHIFGDVGDSARAARIDGMTIGNVLDYLLMPAYALLTLSFFFSIAGETGSSRWRIFGWIGVVAAISDAIENALMFRMVAAFQTGDAFDLELSILPYPVWLKFGLLALSCGGAALAFAKLRRFFLAALCLPAPLLFLPGMLDPFGLAPLATTTIALGWLAMALHAAMRIFTQRKSRLTV